MRLAAQDDEDEEDGGEEEEEEESVQAMVPLKQVRAALVDDIVQVAQVVRESCESVSVRFLPSFGFTKRRRARIIQWVIIKFLWLLATSFNPMS